MRAARGMNVLIGHFTDRVGGTGCTVVLCPTGATAGVVVRGGAPCTRETDIFRPGAGVDPRRVHGVLLTGGSVFGLAATEGVVRFLIEQEVGLQTVHARIPIVAAAGLYDLGVLSAEARPDAAAGYAACVAASGATPEEGTVGAGTGCTVGKAAGLERSTKGGLGVATRRLRNGAKIQALVAVNAFGDVVDPQTGAVIAGIRRRDRPGFEPTSVVIEGRTTRGTSRMNTTIGVVTTDASLTREEAAELAAIAHDGLAVAIRPAHTRVDGDTLFVLATGRRPTSGLPMRDMIALGQAAATAVTDAVVRAVRQATGLGGIPAASELGMR